jgi:hypothetical protein
LFLEGGPVWLSQLDPVIASAVGNVETFVAPPFS